ncbi:GntR family transcriptional regulator [Paenibacillus sp. J2TS4]|uniref:GntR family transcriptional regulator n=1 Tax=Paenibacillus sp. J2TS4 TaxID=2807194 RepID=UPI001B1DE7B4|nr:GntR family transcriptional regulator [Paenibacillus sp. J2TS4]GIP34927.1 HTH-type transcriptional repressor YvoA [Paenibacillus sp. J2TS4]
MSTLFEKTLNKEIPTPLYYQLKEILLEYIINSHDNFDVPIPTEQELSAHFKISRPTVRQAINELVFEGFLYRIKAKGTFVSRPKIQQEFLQVLDSFNNEIKKKGLTPSTKVLSIETVKSDKSISDVLRIMEGSKVIKLQRLRFANEDPIVIVDTFLPYNICHFLLEKNLEQESLYELIEAELSLKITKAVRKLESVLAGDYESQLLNVKQGAPIQFIKSTTFLSNGTPIEYSLAKYRGDRNTFTFEMNR